MVLDGLDLDRLGKEALDIADDANRHQHHVGLDGRLARGCLDLGLDPLEVFSIFVVFDLVKMFSPFCDRLL